MLEIRNVCGGYSGKEVLHGVSLRAEAGRITAVLGPNGCGKSTLLKTICGIVAASSGQITLNGGDLLALPQKQRAQRVSYLAQNRQIPDITVERIILHGRFPYLNYPRRYRAEDRRIARDVMERLKITELAETPLGCLSGGQQQKAYIAMALAQDTDVVLLDEPTTYLDVPYQFQVLRQAGMLAAAGKHVVMVIHDLSRAMETADEVALMKDGGTVIQGTPERVYCSGALDKVFGIKMERIQTGGRWRYFCTEA